MANYRRQARQAAKRYGLDPNIFERQINQESGFDPSVRSPAGAAGIAQIMPGTARSWGVNPLDPSQALNAAAKHMAAYVKQFGSYDDALRAYNAGAGNVAKSHGFKETNDYVRTILGGSNPKGLSAPTGGGGSRRVTLGATGSAVATGSVPVDTSPNTDAITQLTQALQRPEPQPAFSHLSLPDFAAAPPLPQGYQPTAPTAPAPAPDYSQLLQQLQQGSQQGGTNVPVSASAQRSMSAGIDVATGLAGSGASEGTAKLGGALVTAATKRANLIDAQHLPYSWGGGHARKVTSYRNTVPLDCSGAVSAVLGIDPRVSGDFEKFGKPGAAPRGKGITIYANKTHVLMSINGRFFGTSRSNPQGGAGWIPSSAISKGYLKNFTARHVG